MTSTTRSRRPAVRVALVLGIMLAVVTAAAPAASKPQVATGRLDFQLILRQAGPLTLPCPLGMQPQLTACIPWAGSGLVRGLGSVSATYAWLLMVGPPACPADFAKQAGALGELGVAGKGTIALTFAEGARCMPLEDWGALVNDPQEFTFTGGSFQFAAASGTGAREQRSFPVAAPATETWKGTLEVPGLSFDVSAPQLRGAIPRTVRAQKGAGSARVYFHVTATDGIDPVVPVSCRPRSNSRFRIGRTTVRCTATDSSGNTGRAAFPVTVKRRR